MPKRKPSDEPPPVCGRCDVPMIWAGTARDETGHRVTWHMCDKCGRLDAAAVPAPTDDQPQLFPDGEG